ncbi:hypothetical protein KCP74_17500 [Salmonella enterica subsp. enterica]|nr:hypothetical protein KCP74_17500 [Salmonella enterica subsp. enterica]
MYKYLPTLRYCRPLKTQHERRHQACSLNPHAFASIRRRAGYLELTRNQYASVLHDIHCTAIGHIFRLVMGIPTHGLLTAGILDK